MEAARQGNASAGHEHDYVSQQDAMERAAQQRAQDRVDEYNRQQDIAQDYRVQENDVSSVTDVVGVKIKDTTVKVDNLDQDLKNSLRDVVKSYREQGIEDDVVITSGNDYSGHNPKSLHYTDEAIDIRTRDYSDKVQDDLADTIQQNLGPDYYVLSEHYPETPTHDHIHIEKDKRNKVEDASKADILYGAKK